MVSLQESEVRSRCKQAVERFHREFGQSEDPTIAVFAPGRVNLIGEHTDYNGGCVLPMALHLVTVIVGRPIQSGRCKVVTCSTTTHGVNTESSSCEFSVPEYPDTDRVETGAPHWASYVKGVVALMNGAGNIPPFQAVIATSVPLGGGLSSSAALEVATCLFVEQLCPDVAKRSDEERALLCQRAEHVYAGVPCGIMDQFVSVMAKEKCALFLDCLTRETSDVPLSDPDLVVLVTNSEYKHDLKPPEGEKGEYEKRRDSCMSATRKFGRDPDKNQFLKDISMEELEAKREEFHLTEVEYKRARHVIGEIQRTLDAVEALNKGKYEKFGQLMNESHASLRDDYEVSSDELDQLVALTQGQEGVYGSRMTGGGFGGCIVTLLRKSAVERIKQHIKDNYSSPDKKQATCYVAVPSSGARVIPKEQLQLILSGQGIASTCT